MSTAAAARRVAESFQLQSANAIKDAQAAIAKTALLNVKPPKVDLSALIGDIPKLDVGAMYPRVPPLEIDIPKPVRPIADIRLETLVNAVNQLIDVTQAQNEALLRLNDAMEDRHAESEQSADGRAERADNRAAWGVTFAGLAALVVVIEFSSDDDLESGSHGYLAIHPDLLARADCCRNRDREDEEPCRAGLGPVSRLARILPPGPEPIRAPGWRGRSK